MNARRQLRRAACVLACASMAAAMGAGTGARAAAPSGVIPTTTTAADSTSTVTTEFTPSTATPEQVAAATPAQPFLVGISKEYPPICDGVTEAKIEDTGSKTDSDRVDVGAPVIELENLKPNTTYSYCFFIQNVGNKPISFGLSATELIGNPDPKVKQGLVRPPVSVGTWLHPVGTKFSLKPGERQYVPYTIEVPAKPPAGTNAGALEVIRLENGDVSEGGASFFISMLHKVLITFPGGKNEKLKVSNVSAPRVLSRENGKKDYVLRLNVRNVGNMVEVHHTDLKMGGLGRTVGSARSSDSVLLPNGAERVEVRIDDMPWIGIYRPTATVTGRAGPVQVPLPWLLVLPPWPFVVAIILAILLPVFVLVRHWLRSRAEWRAYLEEEDDEDWDDESSF